MKKLESNIEAMFRALHHVPVIHYITPPLLIIPHGFKQNSTKHTPFHYQRFKQNNPFSYIMLPATTSLHLRSTGMPPTLSGRNPMISMHYSTSSTPLCYSLNSGWWFIESATTVPNRSHVVFKESQSGSRLGRFRTSFTSSNQEVLISAKEDGGGVAGTPDLLTIPGVGPRNLEKLVENDIANVDELKKIYKEKFNGKSYQKMVEFLHSSVGIKNKNHAKSIANFVKKSVTEEMKNSEDTILVPKKKEDDFVDGSLVEEEDVFGDEEKDDFTVIKIRRNEVYDAKSAIEVCISKLQVLLPKLEGPKA